MTSTRSVIMGEYGQGHVYRRGNVWWIQYYVDGERRRESSESTVKRDAVQMIQDRLVEYRGLPSPGDVPTFEVAAQAIKARYDMKNRKSDPEKRLKHLRPVFTGRDLRKITTGELEKYATARKKIDGAANATINRELACLRRMMNIMRERSMMVQTPHFPMLDESHAIRTGFIGEDELQAVLTHLPAPLRPLTEFAYITGWRKGEILSRDWKHVSDRSVRIETGESKNQDGREFPLIPRLAAVIETQRERMAGRIGGPLFFWSPGRRIKSFKESWKSAVEAAKLPDLLFHDLRRSAVRNLVVAGIDTHTAMQLTGHKTDSVFRRYDIIDAARLHEQASKLEAFYGQAETKVRGIR